MERIGLFVDVQNIYYTTRHTYGRQFDYRTLWNVLARGGAIAVANAFLLSGDGDFDLLIDAVQTRHDTPVEVYGVQALTADSLVRAATVFHPITESLLV